MKKFMFGLERVRQWRAEQVEAEKLKLRRLFDERRAVEAAASLLERQQAEAQRAILAQSSLEAQQLGALDAFRNHVRREKLRLAQRMAECEHRIAEQRRRLLEVRRQFRLLERMKQREWEDWNRALRAETENLSAEAHLAQWSRTHRRLPGG